MLVLNELNWSLIVCSFVIQDPDSRIYILSMYPEYARQILCQVIYLIINTTYNLINNASVDLLIYYTYFFVNFIDKVAKQ